MATALEFVIKARDEASAAIGRVSGATTDLRGALSSMVTGGGPFGIIAAGAVAATGAIVALSVTVADEVERLDRLSKAAGTSTADFQVLEETFRRFGLSSDDAATSMTFMNRAIGRGEPLLEQLGIKTKDAFEAMMQLSDIFAGSEDAAKKQSIALKLLGKSSSELVGVFGELRGEAARTRSVMTASGGIFSEQTKEDAKKLDEAIDNLSTNWRGALARMQSAVAPWAVSAVQAFNDVWDAVTGRKKSPVEELERQMQRVQAQLDANIKFVAEARGRGTSDAFLKEYDDLIVRLRKKVEEIKKLRDEAAGVGAAADGKGGKGGKDTLTGVSTEGPSPREQRLKALRAELGIGAAAAERYLRALEAVEAAAKRAKTVGALKEAGVSEDDLLESGAITFSEAFPVKPRETRPGGLEAGPLAEMPDPKVVQEVLDNAREVSEAFIDMRVQWETTVVEITSGAGIVAQGLEGLWNGLQNGIGQVFQNMLEKGQTLRSAMKTIFKALAQEVLAILARIAAAKIFGFVMNLLFPGAGGVVGGLIGGAVGGAAGNFGVMAPAPLPTSATGGTVNIYALDRSGIESSLRDPRGTLRAAMRDASLAGAY